MKLAYYPGCTLHGTANEYDISMKATFKELGIELIEIPDWVCCGATSAHATNENLALALPYLHLVQTEKMGLDAICVPCSACFNRLKITDYYVKNDEKKYKLMRKIIGKGYKKTVKIRHPLQNVVEDLGLDELKKKIKRKLSNLKIASYYGCLLVRPGDITGFDDPEHPQMMEKLIETLGAAPIDFAFKQECCGAAFSATKPEMANELSFRIISAAKEQKADCIMVACPLCHINLDLKQKDIENQFGKELKMPILYFTQVIGLALGLDVKSLSLDSHFVNTLDLLKEKGMIE